MTTEARVRLVGEDKASDAFNKAAKSIEHATAKGAAFGTIMGKALGDIVGKAADFAKESIDAFGKVGGETAKLQRYIGGTVEDASRLRFAAQESGVGFDDLTKGLGKFEKTFVNAGGQFTEFEQKVKDAAAHHKAFNGHLGSNATAFAKLGVSIKNAQGDLLPMNQVLPELADKFKEMPNGAEKTAMAMQLFGKGGMALVPMLNKGAEGMRELEKQSDKFGLTLNNKDTAAVKANIVAKREWHAAIEGLQVQLGRYLYPALTAVTSAMVAAIPQIQKLAGPVMKALSDVMTHDVVPILKTMVRVFTNDLLPILTTVATWIDKHQTLMKGLATVIGTVVAGIKIWAMVTKTIAAAQAALNVVLAMNPIGLVVIAIAALAAGLIYAYNHSKTFRDIVNTAFHAVADAASFMWHDVLKPVFKFLVDAWFAVAGAIVHGAADAFGWVPGIGGKLKAAAKEFDKFRDAVNGSLNGITPTKTITVDVVSVSKAVKGTSSATRNDPGFVVSKDSATPTVHLSESSAAAVGRHTAAALNGVAANGARQGSARVAR